MKLVKIIFTFMAILFTFMAVMGIIYANMSCTLVKAVVILLILNAVAFTKEASKIELVELEEN